MQNLILSGRLFHMNVDCSFNSSITKEATNLPYAAVRLNMCSCQEGVGFWRLLSMQLILWQPNVRLLVRV